MLTAQELQALISILARAPLTPGEQIWLQALLDRLTEAAKTPIAPSSSVPNE